MILSLEYMNNFTDGTQKILKAPAAIDGFKNQAYNDLI